MKTYGLIVGKFSPLHRGHEHLISEAEKQCDSLLVLSYSNPEFRKCEAKIRKEWLQARFPSVRCVVLDPINFPSMPDNQASDAEQQEFFSWIVNDVLEYPVTHLFANERWAEKCALNLSIGAGHHVTAVALDPLRVKNPISATSIREAPHLNANWMSPFVRASYVTQKIVLLGGESTGKTTLAKALAEKFDTSWVPEYGRELWEEKNGELVFSDMLRIGHEQKFREKYFNIGANRYLFCDTSPLTTMGYSMWLYGKVDDKLVKLAEELYDGVIFCQADFAHVNDGTRVGHDFRSMQQDWYKHVIPKMKCPIISVTGTIEERVLTVTNWLKTSNHNWN